jgi:hypothetical protein
VFSLFQGQSKTRLISMKKFEDNKVEIRSSQVEEGQTMQWANEQQLTTYLRGLGFTHVCFCGGPLWSFILIFCVEFLFALFVLYLILSVSLDYSFLIDLSVFSIFYFIQLMDSIIA